MFLTQKEDKQLCQEKWVEYYDDVQAIFWDTTNIPLCYKPSSADAQRNLYSAYYAGNVGKGGIFIQPSGWMGSEEIFVGGISDTDYIIKATILEKQQKYLQEDDADDDTTFTKAFTYQQQPSKPENNS
jgi:hypothetical protein